MNPSLISELNNILSGFPKDNDNNIESNDNNIASNEVKSSSSPFDNPIDIDTPIDDNSNSSPDTPIDIFIADFKFKYSIANLDQLHLLKCFLQKSKDPVQHKILMNLFEFIHHKSTPLSTNISNLFLYLRWLLTIYDEYHQYTTTDLCITNMRVSIAMVDKKIPICFILNSFTTIINTTTANAPINITINQFQSALISEQSTATQAFQYNNLAVKNSKYDRYTVKYTLTNYK